jgi:hypothetical protein
LTRFIERRDDKRRQTEGERLEDDLWMETESKDIGHLLERTLTERALSSAQQPPEMSA